MSSRMWDAIVKGFQAVWTEVAVKQPTTVLTSDAAKQGAELLKQKLESLLKEDTIDYHYDPVPFPDFYSIGSSSAVPPELMDRVRQRILDGAMRIPIDRVPEAVRGALSRLPVPNTEQALWFMFGAALGLAVGYVLWKGGDDSSSSSSDGGGDPGAAGATNDEEEE